MDPCQFQKRCRIILILLTFWALCASGRIFYFSVYARTSLLQESEKIARRVGTVPPVRGRIYDRAGILLAWTELHQDLVQERRIRNPRRAAQIQRELADAGIPVDLNSDELEAPLKKGITPAQLESLKEILHTYPEIMVRPRFERIIVDYPAIRRQIGEVELNGAGIQRGISGCESHYETELGGTPGTFTVMLDKYGNWLENSVMVRQECQNGKDVFLPLTLEEMNQGEGADHGK